MKLRNALSPCFMLVTACGGYDAASSDKLEAEKGQIVGVLIDGKGKSHPDAWVQLIEASSTSLAISNNMDSDGSFSLWPPAPGTYNVIGVLGDTEKVIAQNVVMNEALDGINLGTLQGQTVAVLTVHVTEPAGDAAKGVSVQVLGTDAATTTVEQGAGLLPGLAPGTYKVRFSKTGYIPATEEVVLQAEQALLLDDITLKAE